VLDKAGFTKEGELRKEAFTGGERVDVYRYGLLAEEWFQS
jgi:RimJ/RimL family protein N-acetyltransferase